MPRAPTPTTDLGAATFFLSDIHFNTMSIYFYGNYIDVLGTKQYLSHSKGNKEIRCFYFSVIVQKQQKQNAFGQVYPSIFLVTFDKFAWKHFGAFLVGNDTFL